MPTYVRMVGRRESTPADTVRAESKSGNRVLVTFLDGTTRIMSASEFNGQYEEVTVPMA